MSNGIPQVHLTNNVKMKGHTDLSFGGSSFLIECNDQVLACAHAQVLSQHFGVKPGVEDKRDIPNSVEEWTLCPRKHTKGFLKKKLVVENPIKVVDYLNLESDTKILLMDVAPMTDSGNYSGIRIGSDEVVNGTPIALTTCPKDRTDITQAFYFGEVVNDDVSGLFAFVVNEDIPHGSIPGSPVSGVEGKLLGMVVAFQYLEGQLVFFAERTTQLRKDLAQRFGEQKEPEASAPQPKGGPYVSVSIDIEGDGFGSPKELDLRAQIENEVEQRGLGRVVDAGSGMGKMEITFAEATEVDGIKDVLKSLDVLERSVVNQFDD